jgi:hypothetical protein
MMRLWVLAAVVVVTGAAAAGHLTLDVGPSAQFKNVTQAVNWALQQPQGAEANVTIRVAPGTHTSDCSSSGLSLPFPSVQLVRGEGGGSDVVFDCGQSPSTLFSFNGSNVAISGITVRNAASSNYGGAFSWTCSSNNVCSFSLTNSTFFNNTAAFGGGAVGLVVAAQAGPVRTMIHVFNCTATGNSVTNDDGNSFGGFLAVQFSGDTTGASVLVSDLVADSNSNTGTTSASGGAVSIIFDGSASACVVDIQLHQQHRRCQ